MKGRGKEFGGEMKEEDGESYRDNRVRTDTDIHVICD